MSVQIGALQKEKANTHLEQVSFVVGVEIPSMMEGFKLN